MDLHATGAGQQLHLHLLAMNLHIRLICHMFKLMPNWLYKSIFQTEPNMVQALVIADAIMQHVN
jgi:hypothetical protein